MKLGVFSISLTVKDLKISQEFYEKLGFEVLAGEMKSNYLIMKNGDALIGLFQGMFDKNIITFNPGWDQEGSPIKKYDDVRAIHEKLNSNKINTTDESLNDQKGPGSFMITDPDGNTILIDQHI